MGTIEIKIHFLSIYYMQLFRILWFNDNIDIFHIFSAISSNAGIPYITDCVMAEIEKLGMKYRVALRYKLLNMKWHWGHGPILLSYYYNDIFCLCCFCRIAKDPRFERLPCTHKGTYADDCLVQRVTQVICFNVQLKLYIHVIECQCSLNEEHHNILSDRPFSWQIFWLVTAGKAQP